MAKVPLVNPPVAGRLVIRDLACGLTTRADYFWAPTDLLVLSGLFSNDHDLAVIDGVAEPLSTRQTIERAVAFKPDTVFSLTAAITLEGDEAFLADLKRQTHARIFGRGDVTHFAADDALRRTTSFDGFVQSFGDPSFSRLADGVDEGVTSVVLRQANGRNDTSLRAD